MKKDDHLIQITPYNLTQTKLRELLLFLENKQKEMDSADGTPRDYLHYLWRLLPLAPPVEAAFIINTLFEHEWEPPGFAESFRKLIGFVEPLKYKKPPFKSRVRVPVELDDKGNEDITFFAVDQEWKYLATCRSYQSEFDKDNEPTKKSNDYLDIWELPDGIHKSRIRLPKFKSDMMRWYASPDLKHWIYSDLSGELHIVKLDDLLADGIDLSENPSTLKAKFNEFAVDESQGRIFFLTDWREISVASIASDPKVEKTFTVECLKDDESISKIAFSTEKQKLFIGTNKGRIIQMCVDTTQEEQIVQLKRKKGPELLQVTSNGEKLLISGKGYLQIRDCSDLSCFTDLTDRSSGRKSNLGFPRCVHDFHNGKMLISGHDDSARVWDMISGKLLWYIPITLRSGQEKVLQIVPSPTGYHFLYRTKSRLFWLDPRAYLISGTPVSSFTSKDIEWLELMKDQKIAVEWASFLLELQVFLSENKHAIVFPQDLVFGKASKSKRSTTAAFEFTGAPKPDRSDSWLYQLIPELESEQRSSLEDEIFNRLLSDSKLLRERIESESTSE